MIDDDGNARLAIGSNGSIVAAPGTPFARYLQSPVERNSGEEDFCPGMDRNRCYLAPELQFQWPNYTRDKILVTKESDIYGMAVVIYEARSYKPISLGPGSNLMSSP